MFDIQKVKTKCKLVGIGVWLNQIACTRINQLTRKTNSQSTISSHLNFKNKKSRKTISCGGLLFKFSHFKPKLQTQSSILQFHYLARLSPGNNVTNSFTVSSCRLLYSDSHPLQSTISSLPKLSFKSSPFIKLQELSLRSYFLVFAYLFTIICVLHFV